MRVTVGAGAPIDIGATEVAPTIGITDYSRRVTDEFGVTTVVPRKFSRRMSARFALPFEDVDGVQQLLATLRGTSALWEADDRYAWLQTEGFYKEFALDLAVPPLSYCSLTVEGLAQDADDVDDAGEDPAADGGASTLQMLMPIAVTDAVLASSTVPANDATVWASGISYGVGSRTIRTGSRRVYESLIAGNVGNDPLSTAGKWLDVGPMNRWAMFDEALGTSTSAAGGSIVTVFNAAPGALALLDVVGATVRVEVTATGDVTPVYDETLAVDSGALTFLDLPAVAGTVRVTLTGSGTVSIGTLLIGDMLGLGVTEASPSAGITDYSVKEVDDFGEATIVQRAWAKNMATAALIRSDALDVVANRIAAVRARPVLWIADDGTDALTIFGFFKDFQIEVGEATSKLSLSVEGLSKAAQLPAPWAAAIAALQAEIDRAASDGWLSAGEKPQAIIDYTAALANFNALNDRYLALGSPSDLTSFRNDASTAVAALTTYLTGLAPAWDDATQDTPIVAATYKARWIDAYQAVALFQAAITGRPGGAGSPGLNNAPVLIYQRSAAGTPALPSATVTYDFITRSLSGLTNGWSATIPAGTDPLYISGATASATASFDTIASGEWAAAQVFALNGANGLNTATVYLYQRNNTGTAPFPPSVTSTYNFATGTLTGHNNGWTQSDPGEGSGAFLFWTTAFAIAPATSPDDTIASGEWSAVRRMAKDGTPGLSIAEVTVFKRATSTPATPTGGSYDFAAQTLTAPSGWSTAIPAGSDPLYAARGTVAIVGQSGTATPTWLGVGPLAQNGADGQAVDLVFRRSATQPATPAASAGVPSGWYGDTGAVPAGTDPIWASFGERPNVGANYTWQTPKRVEGKDGEDGLPGADGFTLSGGATASIACTANGTPKTGELPKDFPLKVVQGTVDLSNDSATTYALGSSSGGTASLGGTNGKVLTVTALTADAATFVVNISRSGNLIGSQEVKLTKAKDGASVNANKDDTLAAMPSLGGSGAQIGSFTILVPNGATLRVSANVSYFGNGAGSNSYGGQIRGSWTVDGSETFGGWYSGDIVANSGEQAIATFTDDPTYTNSSGVTKEATVRLYGRRSVGTSGSSLTNGYVEGTVG